MIHWFIGVKDLMDDLRKEFEEIPEVRNSLSCHIRIGNDGLYYTSLINFEKLVIWLNGAWFIFQQQQSNIADHERTDHCTDIRNHISNNTKVIER